jgi:hypothetical protein
MYVRNFSHDMFLNTIYVQPYLSLEPIFFKSRKSRDTTIDPALRLFKLKTERTAADRKKEADK